MNPFSRMHIGLLFLALCNMLPAIEADDSWGVFSIAVVSAILSCVYLKWRASKPFPRPLLTLAVLAATVYLCYEMFYPHQEQTVHILDLAHFVVLLSCCKFFDLRTDRDAGLVAIIAFILMIISAFVTASPLFALAGLLDVTLGVAWLIHYHTEREARLVEKRSLVAMKNLPASESRALALEAASSPPAIGTKRTVFACSIILTGISGVVFVTAPRGWSGGLFSRMHGLVPTSVTGFGDAVELTDNPVLEDEATVMRVRFSRFGQPILEDSFQPYMRGVTFDRYYKGRWQRTPTVAPRTLADVSSNEPVPTVDVRTVLEPEALVRQEVWLESVGNGILFAMFPPLYFTSPDIGRINIDRKDFAVEAASSSRKSAYYTVWSPMNPALETGPVRSTRARSLRDGPSDIPKRVREFAQTLIPPDVDPEDTANHRRLAALVRDYLASDQFEYTLDRGRRTSSGDPVSNFLFDSRRGHCEYFASAMSLVCQAMGLRARLVSGFYGGELNTVGGFYQFRRRDAHAWVEVWLPRDGWTVFDPTPPSEADRQRNDQGLWTRTLRFVEYMRFKWSTTVVSFDSRNRADVVEEFERWLSRLTEFGDRPRSIMEVVTLLVWGPEVLVLWQRVLYWILLALFVVLAVLAFRVCWILSLMVRESWPARRLISKTRIRPAEARFYDRLILLLANKGHVKPSQSTPKEFAERLARANHDLDEVSEIVDWFYEAQYGGKPLSRQRGDRVKSFLQKLREDASFGAA